MSAEKIREWLKKMNYPGLPPTDDDLKDLCRGTLEPIFQQITDKVKPRSDIDLLKKNIIINQIVNKNKLEIRRPNDALELYERKIDLEKKINETKISNREKENNLDLLKSKLRTRNAKIKALKTEIDKQNIENVILEKKGNDLYKKYENAQEIKLDTYEVLKSITNKSNIDTNEKLNEAIELIKEHTEKNEYQLQDNISLNSITSTVSNQNLYSTAKKQRNLQSAKKNRAVSSRKNIFESFNTAITSTVNAKYKQKKCLSHTNLTNISMTSTANSTILPSIPFFQNNELQNIVDELWDIGDRLYLFEKIKEMKENMKITLKNLVSEVEQHEIEMSNQKELCSFYNMIVQNELLKLKYQREQVRNLNILKEKTNLPDVMKLEAKEHGVKTAVNYLKNLIQNIKLDTVEADLNSIITDIKDKSTEMRMVQEKIDKHTCLLYDCNSWIDKSFNRAKNIAFSNFPNIEEQILIENSFVTITEKFTGLNYHYNNRDYMKGWIEIYSNPELLDIVRFPYLSHDKILMDIISQKYLIEKLSNVTSPKRLTCLSDYSSILNFKSKDFNETVITDKLQQTVDDIKRNLVAAERAEIIKDFHMSFPYNEMVSTNRLFNGKMLTDFVKEYDEWCKMLGKNP